MITTRRSGILARWLQPAMIGIVAGAVLFAGGCKSVKEGSVILAQPGPAGKVPLWEIKPIEIIEGKEEAHKPLITAENQNLAEWKITGNIEGKLTKTSEIQLWRDTVAKLTMVNPKAPLPEAVTLMPSEPVPIPGKFNSIDFWVYGPAECSPSISIKIVDAGAKQFIVPLQWSPSRWCSQPWWQMGHGMAPAGVTFPAKFAAIIFNKITSTNAVLCFDALSFYQDDKKPLVFSQANTKLPFPTTPDTILPTCREKSYENKVACENGKYSFSYRGRDCNIEYVYTPKTGTLSDIMVLYNETNFFLPAKDGGIIADVNGISFSPDDQGIVVEPIEETFNRHTKKLVTKWRWIKGGQKIEFKLILGIKGKTLIVEASASDNYITAFKIGHSANTPNPKLIAVPFFDNRWSTPKILYTEGIFVSSILDWYNTSASWLQEEKKQVSSSPLEATQIVSSNSAVYNGGSLYLPKTDGKRNPLYERLFITVSPDFAEVLPNIPNPPSPFGEITGKVIYATRMAAFYTRSAVGSPEQPALELQFWKKMKNYGMENMWVRYHCDMWRTPSRSMHFNLKLEAAPAIGGDETIKELVKGLKGLGYLVAPYVNYRFIHPLHKSFDNDLLGINEHGNWTSEPWGYRLKSLRMIEFESYYAPRMRRKFGWNSVYLDEASNTPPWGLVDYDSRVPEAGKLAEILKIHGQLFLNEKHFFKGPVWSEGTSHYFWAGLTDSNYAQNWHPDAPTLVDFQLLKIHVLENDNGVDLSTLETKDLDWKLATQIVYGNMGHLWDGSLFIGGAIYLKDLNIRPILKSYFMMQQLQRYYAMIPVDSIRYNDNGRLVSTSAAIATEAYKDSQVYVKYENGLQVYVNRNQQKIWEISINGQAYHLPPNGYVASLPNRILEYSSIVNNHRVDYVKGENYTYCDGRGTATDFGDIVAAHSYLLKQTGKTTWLTPTPFVEAESIILKGHKNGADIIPYSEHGEILPQSVACTLSDEGLKFQVGKEVFKYEIRSRD